jgi:hypothetical protein
MCDKCSSEPHPLRDTPASDYELYLMRKHREAGTAPAMPKWYQAHWRRCVERGYVTIADSKPKALNLATRLTAERDSYAFRGLSPDMSVSEYIKAYCQNVNLRA